jgi:hypothetical protein
MKNKIDEIGQKPCESMFVQAVHLLVIAEIKSSNI